MIFSILYWAPVDTLYTLLRGLVVALVATVLFVGVAAVCVTFTALVAKVALGAAVISIFAYVTYPRTGVRNG